MAVRVNVCHVEVLDNPSTFFAPFKVEITFEVFENLPHDLEWKLTYVGASDTEAYDQELDSVLVGPVPEGRHKFIFEAEAPNADKLPQSEIVGVTVLILTCSYDEKRFIKIGWFVSNEYKDPDLRENPPTKPLLNELTRTVLNDDVRVTTYAIKWDDSDTVDEHEQRNDDDVTPFEEAVPSCSSTISEDAVGRASSSILPPLSDVTNG